MSTVLSVIFVALLGYFLIVNALYLGITVAALFQLHVGRGRAYVDFDRLLASSATLPLSVIMPAFNESLMLKDRVTAMLASVYGEFEIIVVNDGSTDATLQSAIAEFALEPCEVFHPAPLATATVRGTYRSRRHRNLWLVDKRNGGGADALNAGLNLSHYPVVAHIGADCIVEPDALMHLMRPINFAPDEIVVVGATLRVANGLELSDGRITGVSLPARLVERFQLLEYLSAFVLNRLGWGSLNAMPVISGACGAWPKRLLLDLGGFTTQDTHCDIEATIHAHAQLRSAGVPYRILNVPDATVWTQVPMSWHDLKRQRKRWQRVVFEVLWDYRGLIFNPRYGYFGLICMPYLLIFEGLGPFIESLGFAFVFVLAGFGVLSAKALVLFLCFSLGLSAIVRLVSLLADVVYFRVYSRRSLVTLAALAFLEPLVFHLAQLPQRMAAWFEFLRGQHTHETMAREPIGGEERRAHGLGTIAGRS